MHLNEQPVQHHVLQQPESKPETPEAPSANPARSPWKRRRCPRHHYATAEVTAAFERGLLVDNAKPEDPPGGGGGIFIA